MSDKAVVSLNGTSMEMQLEKKDFKSGKTGYFGQTKMLANGDKFQVQMIATKIESKG